MNSRLSIVALAALTTVSISTIARAQQPGPVAPSQLLAQRAELALTPSQVRELTLLSAQVRRHQQAVLRAPSKPWIAKTKGTSKDVAAARALELLSPEQRELALKPSGDASSDALVELGDVSRPQVLD